MVAVCVSAGIISGMTVGSGRVELCAGGCMTRGIPGIFFPSHITFAVPAELLRHAGRYCLECCVRVFRNKNTDYPLVSEWIFFDGAWLFDITCVWITGYLWLELGSSDAGC